MVSRIPFALALVALGCAVRAQPTLTHGVASGDPLPDAVSIWAHASGAALLSVRYSTDPGLAAALETIPVAVGPSTGFCARIDLTGLVPATTWYYRVRLADPAAPANFTLGPVARFRTAPAANDASDLTVAVTADLQDPALASIFSSMAAVAPDVTLLLGDWPYADSSPAAATLSDYRQKHLDARTPAALQGLLAQTAIIPIYDDHEVANDWDAATDPARVALGRSVWKEFMPVRPTGDAVYRNFRYGQGAEFFVLDTRAYRARNADPDLPGKSMLGTAQLGWLLAGLRNSNATFKFVLSSVPLRYGTTNKDDWEGAMRERRLILDAIAAARIANVVFLTGDQHWAAVHHHREGIPEFQACPATASLRPPPAEPEPEVRVIHPTHAFGVLRIQPAQVPPRVIVELRDAAGALLSTHQVTAGVPARAEIRLPDPDGGFVLDGPHRFRNDGATTALPSVPPGAYVLSWTPPPGAAVAPDSLALNVPENGFLTASADFGIAPDPAHPVLFRDGFDTADLSAWTAVDEGTTSAPSAWFQDDFQLVQSSNIFGGSTAAAVPDKPGTYFAAGDPAWTDVTFSFRVKSHDNDGLGAMFRLAPDGSCYRFAMDAERNFRRLTKKVAGVTTVLAETAGGYAVDHWTTVTIRAIGPSLSVALDGQVVLTAADTSLPSGRIALYCWGSEVVWFDRVVVRQGDVPATPTGALLFDDFTSGSLAAWTVVDQGTISAPSAWSVQNGVALQSSNIYGGTLVGSDPVKPGTFLLRGPSTFDDVAVSASMESDDNDGIGLMFRVVDANNYYRFSMDSERSYRRLVKVVNGVTTTLAEVAAGYVPGTWYRVAVFARGADLRVFVDDLPVLASTDATFATGRVALYCWGSQGTRFDDVLVTPAGPPALTFAASGRSDAFTLDIVAATLPNRPYVIALSLSESPGIPLGGGTPPDPRVIPLNPDPLFFLSLQPQPFFSGFAGSLDPLGRATAGVSLPPGALPPDFTFFTSGIVVLPSAPSGIAAILPALRVRLP